MASSIKANNDLVICFAVSKDKHFGYI